MIASKRTCHLRTMQEDLASVHHFHQGLSSPCKNKNIQHLRHKKVVIGNGQYIVGSLRVKGKKKGKRKEVFGLPAIEVTRLSGNLRK